MIIYVLACKHKALKHKFKEWRKEESENFGLQQKKLQKPRTIGGSGHERENTALTGDAITIKAAFLLEYEELIKEEEIA